MECYIKGWENDVDDVDAKSTDWFPSGPWKSGQLVQKYQQGDSTPLQHGNTKDPNPFFALLDQGPKSD